MPARFINSAVRLTVATALLAATTLTAAAQSTVTPTPPPAGDEQAPVFSRAELAQLVAPIALYPDQLVTQILMAAGYPLEVV